MRARISIALVGVLAVATACGDDSPTAGSVTTAPAATTGSVTTAPAPMTAPTAEDVTTTPVTTTAVTAGTVTTTPGSATAPPGGESDIALEGREFVSSEVEGHDLVEGSQIRVTFYPDYIEGSAGCNFLEFTWSLDGDRLVITEWLMTAMACEPAALMEQDDWLASFVTAGPTVALAGDTLTLTGDAAAITLVDDEVAEPDLELEGTPWVLESLLNAPAVSTVPGTPPPTLNFTAGAVVIDTGCNTGGATYEAGNATLTIGPIRLTRRACTNPDASAREAAVLAVLEGAATYEIEADVLTITNGDTGLIYRATDGDG